jgi:uncharacterized protein YwgA
MNQLSRLFASLYELGINPTMTTFAERKKVQKLVYLLDKVFDLRFGFSYNWYLHGPYSPEVTKIVFDVVEGRQTVSADPKILSSEDLKKINQLKTFLGNDLNSTDRLELLVSLHFLVDCAKLLGLKREEVVSFLKSKKPYFTVHEINEAINRLQALGVLGNCQ